jgi:fluoride exporter
MEKILAVAIGGAIGSLGRYIVALLVEKISSLINFPIATFFANITGCLLIGFFWNYFDRLHISNEFRLFVFTGFLGGYTTFSTFARESMQFFKAGEPLHALGYILASNIAGLAAVALGFIISQRLRL